MSSVSSFTSKYILSLGVNCFWRKLTKANSPSTFPFYPHSNYWATSMEENNKVPYGPIRNEAVQKSANENLGKCLKCFHQWEVNGLFTNNMLLPVVLSSGQFWIWTKFILFHNFFYSILIFYSLVEYLKWKFKILRWLFQFYYSVCF